MRAKNSGLIFLPSVLPSLAIWTVDWDENCDELGCAFYLSKFASVRVDSLCMEISLLL